MSYEMLKKSVTNVKNIWLQSKPYENVQKIVSSAFVSVNFVMQ